MQGEIVSEKGWTVFQSQEQQQGGVDLAPLTRCLGPILGDLEALRKDIGSFLAPETATAGKIFDHVCAHPGKLVRPALFLLSARLVDYTGGHLKSIAAVCEYIHTASLLHDDVVDKSRMRRGVPTSNSLWGDEESILTGDLIYARASELMAETGKVELIQMFARAIRCMSEGELLQLENQFCGEISLATYEKILSGKTAFLMGACCSAAAILQETSSAARQALFDFGYHVGMAFQYMDDGLDYSASATTVGKEVLADLLEGRVTLPLILLRERLPAAEWGYVEQTLAEIQTQQTTAAERLTWIQQQVVAHEIGPRLLEHAREQTAVAKQAIEQAFGPCTAREQLLRLADVLLARLH